MGRQPSPPEPCLSSGSQIRVHQAVHNARQVTGLAHASLSTIWWNIVCTHMRSSLFCTCTVAMRLPQGMTPAADQTKFLDDTYLNIDIVSTSAVRIRRVRSRLGCWWIWSRCWIDTLTTTPKAILSSHATRTCHLMCAAIPEQAQGANLQPQTIAPKELTAAQPAWWKNMRFEWTNKLALGASIFRSASHGAVQIDQGIDNAQSYHLRQ
jgi:hypothetical protein